jgi:capsule biosynthesis phosphatase
MPNMKRIVIDLDGTLTRGETGDYPNAAPNPEVVARLREYREMGFEIVVLTSRNMRTYEGNVGRINVHTLPVILSWLDRHGVPYDEVFVGKPWCGHEGFYVDDKTVRPDEFATMSYSEIRTKLGLRQPPDP